MPIESVALDAAAVTTTTAVIPMKMPSTVSAARILLRAIAPNARRNARGPWRSPRPPAEEHHHPPAHGNPGGEGEEDGGRAERRPRERLPGAVT